MNRDSRLTKELRSLRAEIAQLRAEVAELRSRPPVVYQPVWVAPTMPYPTWDPLRPYCGEGTSAERLPPLPKVTCSSGDAVRSWSNLQQSMWQN